MNWWKHKIAAEIASANAGPIGSRYHVVIHTRELQALLDVAIAAQLLTDSLRVVEEHDDRNLSNATKLARQNDALMRLKAALDKLREMGDE